MAWAVFIKTALSLEIRQTSTTTHKLATDSEVIKGNMMSIVL